MKVAIMQPYFLPYIGYFQLISAVDYFVVYDNIKYTKRGWINRNRILGQSGIEYITLPLKKGSDYCNVDQRFLEDDFKKNRQKLLRRVQAVYVRAPYFVPVFDLFKAILEYEDRNLFYFNFNAIITVCRYLKLTTPLLVASKINAKHDAKSGDRVLSLCKALGADIYINPIGGSTLYSKEDFQSEGVKLLFLQSIAQTYPQAGASFEPWLSILDVMMFNSPQQVTRMLAQYTLI